VNLYDTLGVAPESEVSDIKRSYLAAARRYHPDFHVDADPQTRSRNAARMQALNQAWEILGNPVARQAYDTGLRSADDPGVARRAAREPDLPAGKGWTPRAGDDGWMTDFDGWADEHDELSPDEPRSTTRTLVTMAPVGLLGSAIVLVFLGLLLAVPAIIAVGAICVIFSIGLFILLPMFEMAHGRRR